MYYCKNKQIDKILNYSVKHIFFKNQYPFQIFLTSFQLKPYPRPARDFDGH